MRGGGMSTFTQRAHEANRLSRKIRPLLAGKPPEVIGAVLGELVSLFIAGTRPSLRRWTLDQHIKLVTDLVPESEKEIFGTNPTEELWDKHEH
jgi:hypothetical protein